MASNPVYLIRCLFLLYSLFLCVAYAVEVSFDKKGLSEAVHTGSRKVKPLCRSSLRNDTLGWHGRRYQCSRTILTRLVFTLTEESQSEMSSVGSFSPRLKPRCFVQNYENAPPHPGEISGIHKRGTAWFWANASKAMDTGD